MKRTTGVIVLTAMICFLGISSAIAQYHAQGIKGGVGIGMAAGNTDMESSFSDAQVGLAARFYLRNPLAGNGLLQLEFGLTFASLRGDHYRSNVGPIDLRLLFSPLRAEGWNAYLYGGAGALSFENVKPYYAPTSDKDKFSGVIPVGLGLQFRITEQTALEISGGCNFTLTDKLETLEEGGDDRFFNLLAGFAYRLTGEDKDSDGDGLSDKLEKELGTDRKKADSDGDGLSDGAEYNQHKTNPLVADTDGDGLSDGAEINTYSTSPLKADSDGDGLKDGDEINTYKTDPNKADSDGDGLKDGDEINKYKTDPLKADTDGDGLKDGDEINKHKTDPLKTDSDGDGLSDGDEVNKHACDPTKADTDGDGLNDYAEVVTHKTNPSKADTDGGTITDGVEVGRGTNPLEWRDDLPREEQIKGPVGAEIIMEGILFDTGSSRIKKSSEIVLNKVAQTMVDNPEIVVEIQGHTDIVGSRASNLKLSQARAESVAKYLIAKGVATERITTKGFGPDQPVASNDTAEGRQQNRRITFVRTK